MIKLLGVKRAMTLGLLVIINLALAGVGIGWLLPLSMDADNQLNAEQAEVSRLQGDIQRVKEDLVTLRENLPQYEALKARGFLQEQDRFQISRTLDGLKNRAGLMGFSFTIGEVRKIPNADAATAQKDLITSRIKLEKVSSLLDVNFFKMLELMETVYPPHARVQSFELRKAAKVSQDVLAQIKLQPVSMINANVTLDWLTMTDIPQAPAGAMPGMPGYPGGY